VGIRNGCVGFGLEAVLFFPLGLEHFPVAGGGAFALVVLRVVGVFGILVEGDEGTGGGVEGSLADFAGIALGHGVEQAGVAAGDLEAVEEECGALGVDAVLGERGDGEGERYLDGVTVLEGWEVELEEWVGEDGIALGTVLEGHGEGHGVEDGDGGVVASAATAVAALELDVVVAEGLVEEGERTAALSVGLDVTTEFRGHVVPLVSEARGGTPLPPSRWNFGCKSLQREGLGVVTGAYVKGDLACKAHFAGTLQAK